MQPYNSAKPLRDSDSLYFNINFEVLNGCQFQCSGCFVEKYGNDPINQDYQLRLRNLIDDMSKKSYVPFTCFLGPTDFLVARNTIAVLASPQLAELFKKFKRLSLQTTFLNVTQLSSVASLLSQFYSDLEIEINVILEPHKMSEPSYLKSLETGMKEFQRQLHPTPVIYFGLINVLKTDDKNWFQSSVEYERTEKELEKLFQETIVKYDSGPQAGAPFLDLNFSYGRKKTLSKDEFLSYSEKLKELFNGMVQGVSPDRPLRFSFGLTHDSQQEKQWNYRHGDLFYSPYFYERYVSFESELKMDLKEWTTAELETSDRQLQLSQYQYAASTDECETCPFLASCVERGVIKLMEIYNLKACVVAKEALNRMNGYPLEG